MKRLFILFAVMVCMQDAYGSAKEEIDNQKNVKSAAASAVAHTASSSSSSSSVDSMSSSSSSAASAAATEESSSSSLVSLMKQWKYKPSYTAVCLHDSYHPYYCGQLQAFVDITKPNDFSQDELQKVLDKQNSELIEKIAYDNFVIFTKKVQELGWPGGLVVKFTLRFLRGKEVIHEHDVKLKPLN